MRSASGYTRGLPLVPIRGKAPDPIMGLDSVLPMSPHFCREVNTAESDKCIRDELHYGQWQWHDDVSDAHHE